jgi:hypothetical protein
MRKIFSNIFFRIVRGNSFPQLLILISFLFTFGLARLVTHLQKAGIVPNQTGIRHIHHLVPGIILLIISGYCGISYWHKSKVRLVLSILFGIGAALTIDEFALWLYLKDVYWARQGRDSIDAIIFAIVILLISFTVSEIYNHYHIKKVYRLLKK